MILQAGDPIDTILLTYLQKKTFTCCSVSLSHYKKNQFFRRSFYAGSTDSTKNEAQVNEKTFYDLASLTKPLVTVLSLLILKKERKIGFQDRITKHLPFPCLGYLNRVKLIDLINHTSGLPAHRPYYAITKGQKEVSGLEEVIRMILSEDLLSPPGEKYIYSDLDYLLLGYIVEQISGESLKNFWLNRVAEPLGLAEEFCFHREDKTGGRKYQFAPTGRCSWSGEKLNGVVNDDNCRKIDKACGHAGLFGTAKGVLALCEKIFTFATGVEQSTLFNNVDLQYLVKERNSDQWAYGFDVPTGKSPSSGHLFSKRTIGHLGYTGTSFWIDLEKGKSVVILTNRVVFGDDKTKIQAMRPELHDALLAGTPDFFD